MKKISEEREEEYFKPTSTRDKILQSVFLIVVMYAIYRFCLSFDQSIWVMLFLMGYALLSFYLYFVDCHKVAYIIPFGYVEYRVWVGGCKNKGKHEVVIKR